MDEATSSLDYFFFVLFCLFLGFPRAQEDKIQQYNVYILFHFSVDSGEE